MEQMRGRSFLPPPFLGVRVMPLSASEIIEKQWLEQLLRTPEKLEIYNFDEVLSRLNYLTYKELHDEKDESRRDYFDN
jgi:hypothetical protein